MKKLTDVIKENNSFRLIKFFDYIPATIANIFSIVFSTSIIIELRGIVNGMVLILLSVFIILFLIQNEIIKVKEIRKVFSGNKNALLPFTVTFIISISLASIGMYLFTNKATQIKNESLIVKTTEYNNIDAKYQTKLDEINLRTFENSDEFKNLTTELNYWKRARPANLNERAEIRKKVENLQTILNENRTKFELNKNEQLKRIENLITNEKTLIDARFENTMDKTEKNNFITYIFLTLILITEFSTIVLNKNIVEKRNVLNQLVDSKIAKTYLIASNLLTSLYMSVKNNWVNINQAKYSYANKDNLLGWDEIKIIYNNFISLGILSTGEIREENNNTLLYNEILLTEEQAQMKLDEYFERFLKIM